MHALIFLLLEIHGGMPQNRYRYTRPSYGVLSKWRQVVLDRQHCNFLIATRRPGIASGTRCSAGVSTETECATHGVASLHLHVAAFRQIYMPLQTVGAVVLRWAMSKFGECDEVRKFYID